MTEGPVKTGPSCFPLHVFVVAGLNGHGDGSYPTDNLMVMLACGCPSEYPDWHKKDIDLGGHCVVSLPIPMFLHMPLAYEAYLQRQQQEVTQLELPEIWPGFVLTRTGMLRGRIMRPLHTTQSPSRHVSFLPKPFHIHALLHQGDVGTIKNTVRDMQMALLDRGCMPKELYLSYLTCPRCQDERGGAKIMLLRRWEESARLRRRIQGGD